MRWVMGVVALGLMMALFHRLTGAGPVEARATLALGFLVLAAHLGGGLAARARLPRVTAYLLVGFCVGPSWLGLVRADEIRALDFIAEAAAALIAFAVGSELRVESLRRDRTTLVRASVGGIVLPFLFVALVVLSVSPWFPITVHQPFRDAIPVALVLGSIAAASSPTLTMAVIDEIDARVPFSRALLSVTVAKDLVVIVLFSLALVAGRAVGSPGTVNAGVAWSTAMVNVDRAPPDQPRNRPAPSRQPRSSTPPRYSSATVSAPAPGGTSTGRYRYRSSAPRSPPAPSWASRWHATCASSGVVRWSSWSRWRCWPCRPPACWTSNRC